MVGLGRTSLVYRVMPRGTKSFIVAPCVSSFGCMSNVLALADAASGPELAHVYALSFFLIIITTNRSVPPSVLHTGLAELGGPAAPDLGYARTHVLLQA
jgi:hypothetical protein